MKKIIFSDIDGCMINDAQPDFVTIHAELERLKRVNIDIILTTAKTAHEIIALNQSLVLPGPFIVENGGGLLLMSGHRGLFPEKLCIEIDQYTLVKWGDTKPNILKLQQLFPEMLFLTQMDRYQFADYCDLSLDAAMRAQQRYFTEPLYIKNLLPDALKNLKKQLRHHHFSYMQSNRFLHIQCSKNIHKGAAVKRVIATMYPHKATITFAIGDSFNDFSMLNCCDHAFILDKKMPPRLAYSSWHTVAEKGFLGWKNALQSIISLRIR